MSKTGSMIDNPESDNSTEDVDTGQDPTGQCESEDEDGNEESTACHPQAKSIHASVQRSKISSTSVQEGDEELRGLDIEVYDQQTYERGVFDQVDEAISTVDADTGTTPSTPSNPPNLAGLISLIHRGNKSDTNEETSCDISITNRDEEIIQLARTQRLIKVFKKEKQPIPEDKSDTIGPPKIPRLKINLAKIKVEPKEPSTERIELADRQEKHSPDRNVSEDDDESTVSEYKPSSGDGSVICQDEDYEASSDEDLGDGNDNDTEQPASNRTKKLQDDGDPNYYSARIKAYNKKRARLRMSNISSDNVEVKSLDETVQVEGDLVIPKDMWDNLFEHQRTGVKWFWELHQLGTGGILGDEMGLGKTIQMIAFLTALKVSDINDIDRRQEGLGPTVLVCPATVMHQWLAEIRKWWPPFRVAILHSTGSFTGDRGQLVRSIHRSRGILIVSYSGVVVYQDYIQAFEWHYAILDEGHKIRNPDAQITLACKRFRTPHRIILSGSPVQNNLKELWSIFDFIFPGKLGTLPVFMEQFGIPITQGGYANATDIQVQIAYKCSCVLRDTIKPFLLRRTKSEVNDKLKLPERSEQVLFCKLTDRQRKLYQAYLDSPTIRDIKKGHCQIFVGLIELRKICNHPDLFDTSECQKQLKQQNDASISHREFFSEDETFGHYKKSGKMMVVDALLKLWKKQNHKVLLFTQSRQMLNIFSSYLTNLNYQHLIMDGSTPIGSRQSLIEQFNKNEDLFVFLLTTRVGGVGINLTGANRIIIYDPDWNPSTDIQARERAWRIGQQRHVIIYRLLTAGTIEEKIYHRQVFKLYLTNRVLKDVKQKRFFKTNDLHELFTLGHNDKDVETKALFDDNLHINPESLKKRKDKRRLKKKKNKEKRDSDASKLLSDDKLKAMRERAKMLSKMIAQQYGDKSQQSSEVDVRANPSDEVSQVPVTWTPTLVNPKPEVKIDESHSSGLDQEKANKSERSSKRHIDYLVRQDIYRHDSEPEPKREKKHKQEDYILTRLFKNSNISGALKHDKIETDCTADFKVVESEAEKVARDAIRALRESRRLCLDSSMGVPNWTGRNGQIAAAPRSGLVRRRRGPVQLIGRPSSSSSDGSLLNAIKKRNHINPVSLAQSTFNVIGAEEEEERRDRDFEGRADGTGAEELAEKLRNYLLFKAARRGEAQTEDLLSFFNENFKPDKTPIFKAILYKMCEFQRRGDKGFWVIKSEFRDM